MASSKTDRAIRDRRKPTIPETVDVRGRGGLKKDVTYIVEPAGPWFVVLAVVWARGGRLDSRRVEMGRYRIESDADWVARRLRVEDVQDVVRIQATAPRVSPADELPAGVTPRDVANDICRPRRRAGEISQNG